MCERGSWRGFHTRYLKTPDGVESPLVVIEQCTECNAYRARDLEDFPYVSSDSGDKNESGGSDSGSAWGGSKTSPSDTDGW